ncbi:MAG: nucleoside-diphosphate sugar epimerase [Acidobacteria bacterium RIFCSPLOWO2_02_FULL_68_18]|nr:MAG: nucleoside-diphosphate sugar epimerase [Acidobacteria bacterium RIFCSPLOWO2_02_FULL_68_18]OFW48317.1 MAG: nucleoside-diphosphate sugar epimerase [Acidobacteria bacterium RIFCSPLOWO2_12_FULL_68_19]
MKILVTGGCGFLGSHVCELFRSHGWDVVAYDNLTKYELDRSGYDVEEARSHNRRFLESIGVQIVVQDVRDMDALTDAVDGVDFIAHTAAQPAMTISWEDPRLDFESNALGTFNVLEAARLLRIPVAACSSIHTYGTGINDEITEDGRHYARRPAAIPETHATLTGVLTPLHGSKHAGEVYSLVYGHTYGVRAAAFRYTGIYGPRQLGAEDHGWAANFVIRNLTGRPIRIFGNGLQTRDILYASDAARAFWNYFQRPVAGIYNIGGGPPHAISLLEAISLIESITSRRSEVVFEPERKGDLRYFVSDIDKAASAFGFKPSIQPREGLTKLAEWVSANLQLFGGSTGAA